MINLIFKKLNLENQNPFLILNTPKIFGNAIPELIDFTQIDIKKFDT